MWIVYHEPKFKIVGLSPYGGKDSDKRQVIREIVNGLYKPEKLSEYKALQEVDAKKARQYLDAFPERLAITGNDKKPRISIREKERFSLYIEIDAPDKHPVDGIPEIKADGKSFTTISIQKIDDLAQKQTNKNDNEELFFRTDHGIIRDSTGKKDINSVKLENGVATVRLYSETVKRVATVKVFSEGDVLQDRTLRVEFI